MAEFQLRVNQQLKQRLQDDLRSLAVRCQQTNEKRKFAQESVKPVLEERSLAAEQLASKLNTLEAVCSDFQQKIENSKLRKLTNLSV